MSYPKPRANLSLPSSVDKSKLEAQLQSSLSVPFPGVTSSLADLVDGYEPVSPIDNSGTTTANAGTATVNAPAGKIKMAAGATTAVLSNTFITAGSQIMLQLESFDTTATQVKGASQAAGTVTVTLNAASTAAVVVGFAIFN